MDMLEVLLLCVVIWLLVRKDEGLKVLLCTYVEKYKEVKDSYQDRYKNEVKELKAELAKVKKRHQENK
jgi:hypothetical protein